MFDTYDSEDTVMNVLVVNSGSSSLKFPGACAPASEAQRTTEPPGNRFYSEPLERLCAIELDIKSILGHQPLLLRIGSPLFFSEGSVFLE